MQILNSKSKFSSSNILPLFVLITLGVQGLLLLMNLVSTAYLASVAGKKPPSLVQLVDGQSIATEAVDQSFRTPMVVHRFTKDTMQMLFTWNNVPPVPVEAEAVQDSGQPQKPPTDPGVRLDSGLITTAAWEASFGLAEDFRGEFLGVLAKLTPSDVFSGGAQSVLDIKSLSYPIPLKDGRWQLDMVANLIIFSPSNPQGKPIVFNKSIFVRAVEPLDDPLPENSTPLQRTVYGMRQSGLEVTEIRELSIRDLTQ